jgi:hypothetical protein
VRERGFAQTSRCSPAPIPVQQHQDRQRQAYRWNGSAKCVDAVRMRQRGCQARRTSVRGSLTGSHGAIAMASCVFGHETLTLDRQIERVRARVELNSDSGSHEP